MWFGLGMRCRDVSRILISLGALSNSAISVMVKRAIKQPRPLSTCNALGKCGKFGMPSSHAQVMAFAVATAILMHLHRRWLRRSLNLSASSAIEVLELVGLGLVTGLVSVGRVYLGYHSAMQVVAGLLLGAGWGSIWFVLLASLHKSGATSLIQSVMRPALPLRNDWMSPYKM